VPRAGGTCNDFRRSDIGGDHQSAEAVLEGEREQQEEREAEKSHSREDIHWSPRSGELQFTQTLRQQ